MNLINYDPHKKTHPVNPLILEILIQTKKTHPVNPLILEILIQTKKTHPVHPHNPGNPDSDK
ncbi:MAG: hypothetical protein HCA25_25560 [Dolichospermum sp. DET50]|nr:hypothetical protein [Dolichospermum sp. DET67]MBS3040704.1 hypothetical protein [Dolichospermum sp. DET50]QSX67828.1 MAG: hypothetical protein EZY12_24825 [Dolichospermum sp. DET69]